MTSDGGGNRAGEGWLTASLIVAAGFPIVFGTFLGNIVEALGIGVGTPGIGYSFWAQSFFFAFAGIIAAVLVGVPWTLVRRGRSRAAGWFGILAGVTLTPLGVWIPVTGWVIAGPLSLVGGGLALRDGGSE